MPNARTASALGLLAAGAALAASQTTAPRAAPPLTAAPAAPARTAASSRVAASASAATPHVTLHMRFQPDRPGQSTTIHWSFTISQPAALRTLQLRLPPGLGFAASSLGLESCELARLVQAGPEGCPPDSLLGFGEALAEVQAETTVLEKAKVTALLGPREAEGMTVLFFVDGRGLVNREVVLTSHLSHLADAAGATLLTEVPPLLAWPDGPDIGLVRFSSTIGPQGLTYYRQQSGRTIPFAPRGLTVPTHCPRGGFPVSATFTWWHPIPPATATTHIPCPKRRR